MLAFCHVLGRPARTIFDPRVSPGVKECLRNFHVPTFSSKMESSVAYFFPATDLQVHSFPRARSKEEFHQVSAAFRRSVNEGGVP